ncbi:MAG: hypothetical protein U5L05_01270 [Rubrivivax sp.]|nr:hypothetical protein [Rubrivivax sp.]
MTISAVHGFNAILLFGLVGVGVAAPAAAQSNAEGLLNNAWVFNLGGYFYQTGIKANLNGASSQNPEVDFDKTFGDADDANRVRLDALWRITPAHHLRFMYFDNSQSRSRVLGEDVQWGDYTFLAGSNARFDEEFKAYALAYEWAFMRSPTYEVSASIGVNYMDMSFALSGTVNGIDPDGNPVTGVSRTRSSDLPAPLPMIGLRAGWVVAPNWYVDAQVQWFQIAVDEYDGRWTDARVGATWMFHRNFGVGLGYNWFGTRVDVEKNDFNGRLKLGYSGIQAYLTGTF